MTGERYVGERIPPAEAHQLAVDDQIGRGLLDDDDGSLLSGLSQRRHQLPEPGRVADPEVRQAAVQLMKL